MRDFGNAEVLLLPHKDGSGYSYVNLTKGHICPCVFPTPDVAIADCLGRSDVKFMLKIPEVEKNDQNSTS